MERATARVRPRARGHGLDRGGPVSPAPSPGVTRTRSVARAKIRGVGWLWIALLACAVAVLIAAEWPRLSSRTGLEARRRRERAQAEVPAQAAPNGERRVRSGGSARPGQAPGHPGTRPRGRLSSANDEGRPQRRRVRAGSPSRSPCCATPGSRRPAGRAGAARCSGLPVGTLTTPPPSCGWTKPLSTVTAASRGSTPEPASVARMRSGVPRSTRARQRRAGAEAGCRRPRSGSGSGPRCRGWGCRRRRRRCPPGAEPRRQQGSAGGTARRYGFRLIGSAVWPSSRFSSPACTMRGSTRTPLRPPDDGDAEVRDRPAQADAVDLLRPGEPARDARERDLGGIAVLAHARGSAASRRLVHARAAAGGGASSGRGPATTTRSQYGMRRRSAPRVQHHEAGQLALAARSGWPRARPAARQERRA